VAVEQCVDEVVKMVKSPQFAETDASRAKLRDVALAHHVRAALRTHSATSQCAVRVEAEAGRVDLRGTVDYIEQSEACSDIAKRIKGVRELENHLHVAETGRPGGA
jgi:osmotically-inducible protein OsmY